MKRDVFHGIFDIAVGYHVVLEPRGNYRHRKSPEYDAAGIRKFDVDLQEGVVEKIASRYFYVNIGSRDLVKVDKETFESIEPDCNASYVVWPDEGAVRARFETSEKRRLMSERLRCGYSSIAPLDAKDTEIDNETVCRMWEAMSSSGNATFWKMLTAALPSEPTEGKFFWSNGDKILSKDEDKLNAVADLLDDMGYSAVTGFYDPKEDEDAGQVDSLTGYHYLDV